MDSTIADQALWVDGEWSAWDSVEAYEEQGPGRLVRLDQGARPDPQYPNADRSLLPHLRELLSQAKNYFNDTGHHLDVYDDIGWLFGAVRYGVVANAPHTMGAVGTLGQTVVDMRTIAPQMRVQSIPLIGERWFKKLLVVKINRSFEVRGKLFDRDRLRKQPVGRYWVAYDEPLGDELWVPGQIPGH